MPADAKSIFLAAADKSAVDRAAFLDDACAGDTTLRQRVEALLRAHDEPSVSPMTGPYAPAAPAVEELAPLFPQLEVIELLGAGGMGAVYKARQPTLDRLVALKVLPRAVGDAPAFAERFTREARTLAKLSHPGIVPVYDFGTTGGLYWFVMEYVDGVNLRQAQRAGTLTPAAALAVVPQICAALQYAHDEGFVHRDVKPENVLLDRKGRVKVADFGLAKLLGRGPDQTHLTGTYQAMGTPHYMAPEQWERPLAVDHRADIYSLGVVFYELLTGELPLGRFAPPSQKVRIDVRLDDVVLRTLEKEPERRYQRVGDVKTDIERIGDSETVLASPLSPPGQVSGEPQFGWPVVLQLLALPALILVWPLTILLVVLWLIRRRPDPFLQAAGNGVRWLAPRIWHSGPARRLRAEPFVGFAALVAIAAAVGTHLMPWLYVVDPRVPGMWRPILGIQDDNCGIPSAIALVAALALAVVATLVPLLTLQERIVRVLVVLLVAGALVAQKTLIGQSEASGSSATWGLYAAITLTLLGLVFSVLRLLDRPRTERAAVQTRATT